MSELYLIAHKVRGESAFDVAVQMTCPKCNNKWKEIFACIECDGLGHWWIIPTSGHRAYPYDWVPIDTLKGLAYAEWPSPMPEGLPDHYANRPAPNRLESLLAMIPKPTVTMKRRL